MTRADGIEDGPAADRRLRRVLGTHAGAEAGPLLLCLGGIHGNEPAGVQALERVLEALDRERPPMRGRLVGLAGNVEALARSTRYVDHDLNRGWIEQRVRALAAAGDDVETREQRDLLRTLREVLPVQGSAVCFLDLHTSSAEGVPFACVGDTLRNRRFAAAFPVPVILGLEEQIDGALLEFLSNRGLVTMGFEGGQHDDPAAVDHHEAAVWLALVSAGCLDFDALPRIAAARTLLERSRGEAPRVLDIRYRHRVRPGDRFAMRPGYRSFQRVAAGEVVADDERGPITAHYPARILLPLYQGQGDDGFFLARRVHPGWLLLSAALRRLRVDRVAHWLPGVRRHPERADALLVDRRVARWFTVEIFHLLGFRKRRAEGDRWVFSRRRFDFRGPERIEV